VVGLHSPLPELFTRKSSFPPVVDAIEEKAASIEGDERTSSSKVVIPNFFRCAILSRERAVAKTWTPCLWNACARESPIPPRLQPVMSAYFVTFDMIDFVMGGVDLDGREGKGSTRDWGSKV